MSKQYKFVDLFAGCGGLSLGLQQAGFTPWFVNEIVEQFCNTYKFNHDLSDEHYFVGDIAELNLHLEEYKDILSDITLVCGGPPCQGFSMANRQRILDDPRNALYKQYLIFLKSVRPKFFIMENVKGMMNKIEEIKQNFEEYLGGDYQYDYALLKAQDYGVPQNRERFIMIGNRMGVATKLIFEEIFKHKRKPFVLKDALEGLPHLVAKKEKGSKGIECAESGFTECDFSYIKNDFYKFINGDRDIIKLYNHKNRYNNERDIEIYRRLPQGANTINADNRELFGFFSKICHYPTLRLILCKSVILVEGPTDEMIVTYYYQKMFKKHPFDDGVELVSVNGTAFKAYVDLMNSFPSKRVAVITDNDGFDEAALLKERGLPSDLPNHIKLFTETNRELNTLEPSFVSANKDNLLSLSNFFHKKKVERDTEENLVSYLENNKTQWSFKLLENVGTCSYNVPQYIINAIDWVRNEQ